MGRCVLVIKITKITRNVRQGPRDCCELIKEGFIMCTARGREVTEKAYCHLKGHIEQIWAMECCLFKRFRDYDYSYHSSSAFRCPHTTCLPAGRAFVRTSQKDFRLSSAAHCHLVKEVICQVEALIK